jgi:hypothetical protein
MNELNQSASFVKRTSLTLERLGFQKGLLLAFVVGFAIRLIPELLSFTNPIGWDTIYYAARINEGIVFNYWTDIFSTWLIYGILVTLGNLASLDPFIILKVVGPILYGGTAAGIFFVAWKKLKWTVTKSILASCLFAFQLAALSISWHFYRNILGIMLLLFTIPLLKKELTWKQFTVLAVLSMLVVWGHELAAVSLFAMIFGLTFLSIHNNEQLPIRPMLATIPALTVFLIGIFKVFPSPAVVETNVLQIGDSVLASAGGVFFLTDYLNVLTPVEHYTSYFELFTHVFSLFFLLYLVLLPLMRIGYFKDRVLGSWAFLLVVGSFSCLVVPFSALMLWNRWMLLLVFPFTFFAVEGLWKIAKTGKYFCCSGVFQRISLSKNFGCGLALVSVVVGTLFMSFPLIDGKYGIIGVESTFRYVPSTMQSSSVPLQDTQATKAAFDWLNNNMSSDSSVLVHDVFNYWSKLYLDSNNHAILFNNDLNQASQFSLEHGFTTSYTIWWNQEIGWYNLELPTNCVSVFDSGRISVYKLT